MLEMFLYAIGIIYSPGPVTIISIDIGINKMVRKSMGFFVGVGLSTLMYLLTFGMLSEKIISPKYQIFLSIIGAIYIIYLGSKIWKAKIDLENSTEKKFLGFKDGFIIQTINPKAIIATLPIVTIYFPNNNIVGLKLIIIAIIIGILAGSSPFLYGLIGNFLGNQIKDKVFFSIINKVMSIFLIILAFSILWNDVYSVLIKI